MLLPRTRRKSQRIEPEPLNYFPAIEGLVITDGADFYWIQKNRYYRFLNNRAYRSWAFDRAIMVEPDAIERSPVVYGGILGFRDGSMLRDIVSGKMYLVSGSKIRLITSPDILEILGRDRLVEVGPEEIGIHKEGEPLGV